MPVGHLVTAVTAGELPAWLVNGLLLGVLVSLAVFAVYATGVRLLDLDRNPTRTVDPHALRRAEVRAYLAAIGESAEERTAIADIVVDFWLPDRHLAITFDADAYFHLREADVEAILLEHEVPGDRIGPRLPFEVPPLAADAEPGDTDDWAYEALGVESDATWSTITTAYRDRLKEVHPDQGGDAKALAEVLDAYEHLASRG